MDRSRIRGESMKRLRIEERMNGRDEGCDIKDKE